VNHLRSPITAKEALEILQATGLDAPILDQTEARWDHLSSVRPRPSPWREAGSAPADPQGGSRLLGAGRPPAALLSPLRPKRAGEGWATDAPSVQSLAAGAGERRIPNGGDPADMI